jgi:ligand-binding SRPBCC domain-containing protein
MKEIILSSTFKADFREVKENFNKNLFEFLLPKIPPSKILRYDGHELRDEIHLIVAKQKWVSIISQVSETQDEYSFTDSGRELPFPITHWKHKHRVLRLNEKEVVIIDEIQYECKNEILTKAFYPILLAQFSLRINQYKNYFENKLYE